jgi:hypothetical protein
MCPHLGLSRRSRKQAGPADYLCLTCRLTISVLSLIFFFLFWWQWGLNSGLCICKADTLSMSHASSSALPDFNNYLS